MNRLSLTLAEAAEVLGCGVSTLYDHLVVDNEGSAIDLGHDRLRLVRIGSRILVPRAELARVIGEEPEVIDVPVRRGRRPRGYKS